jgi:hypothetical protein
MQTGDTRQLRQDAVEKIIFHATPKKWLSERGPWLLEGGQGAFLYDADGCEYRWPCSRRLAHNERPSARGVPRRVTFAPSE